MNFQTLVCAALALALISCQKKDESTSNDSDTAANQIGDVMASIDESGGSDGGFAYLERERKHFARLFPAQRAPADVMDLILPKANAASCFLTSTFGSCTNNVVVRDFQNCTIGAATFTGTVTFTFNDGATDNTCTMDSDGDTITRDPDFTITGPRGGSYSVAKTATIGQRITRTAANTFAFSNDGIRRVVSYRGTTLADYTTVTTSNIGITGATRNGRVVSGGTLRVTNNLTGLACDFSPTA
ncbi:MAG TPA: hypothetical protein VFV50_11915, partial [Bdellovibrionales bacterium]|nr:hypothetical protein [Bdellovibrionales bacterium]